MEIVPAGFIIPPEYFTANSTASFSVAINGATTPAMSLSGGVNTLGVTMFDTQQLLVAPNSVWWLQCYLQETSATAWTAGNSYYVSCQAGSGAAVWANAAMSTNRQYVEISETKKLEAMLPPVIWTANENGLLSFRPNIFSSIARTFTLKVTGKRMA